MTEEQKAYIDKEVLDKVVLATSSSVQALTNLVGKIQQNQHEFHKELITSVDNQIKKTVNGKIDKLNDTMNNHIEKHDADMVSLSEIIESRKDNKIAIKVLKKYSIPAIGAVGGVITTIGYWETIKNFFHSN
jgi:hypothetical protein